MEQAKLAEKKAWEATEKEEADEALKKAAIRKVSTSSGSLSSGHAPK